VIRYHPS